jgi:hypothetical protein
MYVTDSRNHFGFTHFDPQLFTFLGNLKAICIHHYFTLEKCQITDLISENKCSIVLSKAAGYLFNFPLGTVSVRYDTNIKYNLKTVDKTAV